jgi:hypothetical protein
MLDKYSQIIQLMPIHEHGFKTKRIIWEKYEDQNEYAWLKKYNDKIFQGERERIITRGELLNFFSNNENDVNLFILLVIYWGYPSGMRNNYFEEIIKKMSTLNGVITEIKDSPVIENFEVFFIEKTKGMNGLGLSTFSKLLYFLNVKIEGEAALILDLRIIDILRNSIFRAKSFEKIRYENAYKKYPEYLKYMKQRANTLNATSEQLEIFMFIFGGILQSQDIKMSS